MDKSQVQIGNGREGREKYRGRMTAAEVLRRYKDDDLPAFGGIDLTDVNQAGLSGEHPLDVAAVRGNLEELYALLDSGTNTNARRELGNTALHEAIGQGHVDVVKLLLEFGARTDIRNELGQTALDIASLRNHEDLVAMLKNKD